MEYAAIALAVFGGVLGLRFRFRVLLAFAVLVVLGSLAFLVIQRFSVVETLLTILAAQAILQGSYFSGLAIRAMFRAAQRRLPLLDE